MTTVVLLVLTAFTLLANYSLGRYSRNFSWKNSVNCWSRFYWLDLPRQQWSLLNRFRTEQGHCGACRRKWRLTDTDLCPCGETLTMSHIVESCPLTKLNGGLSRLHSADEDAVSWLTSYGSWHADEKKKITHHATANRALRLSMRQTCWAHWDNKNVRTNHERAQVVLQFFMARLEAAVWVVTCQSLVHAGNEGSDRAALLSRVVICIYSDDHQVLQLFNITHTIIVRRHSNSPSSQPNVSQCY